jgi:hypothetical protein
MSTTTAVIVPLELPQAQQSAEAINNPCAVLDRRQRHPPPEVFNGLNIEGRKEG